jgi:hypothetical protein
MGVAYTPETANCDRPNPKGGGDLKNTGSVMAIPILKPKSIPWHTISHKMEKKGCL